MSPLRLVALIIALVAGGYAISGRSSATADPAGAGAVQPLRTTASTGRGGAYYVPRGEVAGPLPLLVLLHGRGGKGSLEILHVTELAEREKFVALAPDSTSVAGTWLVGHGQGEIVEDQRHVMECVQEILGRRDFRIDRAKVLAAGFSNGARAAGLVATREDLFTAFATLHGGLVSDVLGSRQPRGWLSTGGQDRVFTINQARGAAVRLTRDGFSDITVRIFPVGHELGQEELAALVAWWLER